MAKRRNSKSLTSKILKAALSQNSTKRSRKRNTGSSAASAKNSSGLIVVLVGVAAVILFMLFGSASSGRDKDKSTLSASPARDLAIATESPASPAPFVSVAAEAAPTASSVPSATPAPEPSVEPSPEMTPEPTPAPPAALYAESPASGAFSESDDIGTAMYAEGTVSYRGSANGYEYCMLDRNNGSLSLLYIPELSDSLPPEDSETMRAYFVYGGFSNALQLPIGYFVAYTDLYGNGQVVPNATSTEQLSALVSPETVNPTPTPTPTPEPTPQPTIAGRTYVLNTNTMKFHYPSCSSVGDIKPQNRKDFTGTRDEVIAMGYDPCKRCKP